jgi:hypothetical protein
VKQDRLEQLLEEIGSELENRREEDRLRLAEWFESVLNAEHNKSAVRVNLVEALRQGHGLGDGEEEDSKQ